MHHSAQSNNPRTALLIGRNRPAVPLKHATPRIRRRTAPGASDAFPPRFGSLQIDNRRRIPAI
jgi:hypothetical protein